jgi:hypothetical protein
MGDGANAEALLIRTRRARGASLIVVMLSIKKSDQQEQELSN